MGVKKTKRGKARSAPKKKQKKTRWEDELARQIAEAGLTQPVREYRFHPKRRWRSDFAWPDQKLLAEVDGGIFMRGRHVSPMGFIKDAEKRNAAVLLGFRPLHFTPNMIQDGSALKAIEQALEG